WSASAAVCRTVGEPIRGRIPAFRPILDRCSTGSRTSTSKARAHGTARSCRPLHLRASRADALMGNQIRATATLAVVGLLCAPRPADAQVFKVGSFIKPGVTGAQI